MGTFAFSGRTNGGTIAQRISATARESTMPEAILYCDSCDYAANQERASSRLQEFDQDDEQRPMEAVLGEHFNLGLVEVCDGMSRKPIRYMFVP